MKKNQVSLINIADAIFQGMSLPRTAKMDDVKYSLKIIGIKDIINNQIDVNKVDAVAINGHKNTSRYVACLGDVVVTCRGTLIKSAVVPKELEGSLISSNLIAIRLNKSFEPELLAAYLQSPAGQKALLANVRSSTMQLALNVSDIEKIELPLIPKNEQKKMAGLIASANQYYQTAVECANLRREIAHLIALNDFTQGVSNE